jgi:hypothetical protein
MAAYPHWLAAFPILLSSFSVAGASSSASRGVISSSISPIRMMVPNTPPRKSSTSPSLKRLTNTPSTLLPTSLTNWTFL